MNNNPIGEFILANARNLRIAAAVSQAWPEARKELVSDFLKQLEKSLAIKLKGWNFKLVDGDYFVRQFARFTVRKPAWGDLYYVSLECWNYGEKMIFGVWRDAGQLHRRPFSEGLLDTVKEHYPSARPRTWYEAQINMRTPAPDWRKPEVLWRMHADKRFLDDVAQQLLEVAVIAGPFVDRMVRRK